MSTPSPLPPRETRPLVFGFLLLEGFDLQAFGGAVEALALANRAAGRPLYAWAAVGETAAPVKSRSSVALPVTQLAGESMAYDRFLVCAAAEWVGYANPDLLAWLRRLRRHGTALGAIEHGAWLLARAGVLAGRRVAVQWSSSVAFTESFNDVEVARERYVLEPDTATAIGGIAAFELLVEWIRRDHGNAIADQVAATQGATLVAVQPGRTLLGLAQRLGIRNRHLATCLDVMEAHVEQPLSNSELAGHVGISVRHLERLFRHHLATTPAHFYRTVRLEQAKRLIQQTQMPVTEIAMATGFFSVSHFGRTFREAFGETPRRLRAAHTSKSTEGIARALL